MATLVVYLAVAAAGLAWLVRGVTRAREAANVSVCFGKLSYIHIALLNYQSVHGAWPPAYVADEQGKPAHSWRVLILPFLEEHALYRAYHFDEPWDGPNNRRLLDRMPAAYACSDRPGTTYTGIAAYHGAGHRV